MKSQSKKPRKKNSKGSDKHPVVSVFSDDVLEVMAKINKKYGDNAIISGDRLANVHMRRIPTEVFDLDARVGGGFPRGRITLLVGKESSSKTTLALKAAGNAQRRCRYCDGRFKYDVIKIKGDAYGIRVKKPCKCGENKPNMIVYGDIEGTTTPEYAMQCGFDVRIALFFQPEFAERGINIGTAMIQSGECDVLVIDSIAALEPTVEVEDGAEKWQQGLGARLVNKMFRMIGSAMNSLGADEMQKPAIICINQYRQGMTMYGDPNVLPYGNGQKFAASLRIDLDTGKPVRFDDEGREVETKGEVVGIRVRFRVKKNKVSSGQGASGEYKLYTITSEKYGIRIAGVNNDEQVIGFGKVFGIIDVAGGGNYSYRNVKARGEAKFLAAVQEAGLWKKLKKEVTAAIQQQAVVVSEEEDE